MFKSKKPNSLLRDVDDSTEQPQQPQQPQQPSSQTTREIELARQKLEGDSGFTALRNNEYEKKQLMKRFGFDGAQKVIAQSRSDAERAMMGFDAPPPAPAPASSSPTFDDLISAAPAYIHPFAQTSAVPAQYTNPFAQTSLVDNFSAPIGARTALELKNRELGRPMTLEEQRQWRSGRSGFSGGKSRRRRGIMAQRSKKAMRFKKAKSSRTASRR